MVSGLTMAATSVSRYLILMPYFTIVRGSESVKGMRFSTFGAKNSIILSEVIVLLDEIVLEELLDLNARQ